MLSDDGRMRGPFIVAAAMVCAALVQAWPLPQKVAVEYAGCIGVPSDLGGVVPEDVDAQGRVLLLAIPKAFATEPYLAFWNIRTGAFEPPVRLEWPGSVAGQPQSGVGIGAVRFLSEAGTRAVALQGCTVVLVDLGACRIERVIKVPGITPSHLELVADTSQWPVLSVDGEHGRFAVFFNDKVEGPKAFIYSARAGVLLSSWTLPRFVESAAWSPDGRSLAVLYSGAYDSRLNYYDVNVKRRLLTLPDVAVFDAVTGHLGLSFFSGQPEAQVAYSPDGRSLYCIVDSLHLPMTTFPHHGRDAIRVFSAADGSLTRAIRVPRSGVRFRFALSPDGKLIAAEATTRATWVPHDPPPMAVRFVLLDVATGKKLFEHEETWRGGEAWLMTLLFSPDGRTLVADPYPYLPGEGPVEIYKLLGTP